VRTGDTPVRERSHMSRRPPHILVTTPESLYVLLGSVSGRGMLSNTRRVIVDEIHALAGNKRGAHLALSLERLTALCGGKLQRIGLSATQKPIADVAHFLVGAGPKPSAKAACHIVDAGHVRVRDLALELPPSPLSAVMSGEVWSQVYDRLADLVGQHRTTLVFVNTRRMVERVSRALAERIGEDNLAAHHGSLSKESRLDAEQRLKHGKLQVLVATASLELGIDIGEVDLVCQLASPRSIASFLQRVGRSGHAVGATPKGRLFPLSRDELVECAALLDSVHRGELDRLMIPAQPLDVLAQQIAAEVAAQDWSEHDLFALVRRAWPFRALARDDFAAIVEMLADGFTTRRGRRGALIHHDAVNHMLRGRRGARLTAITSGGAIPDNADYRVLLEPENIFVGTVHEDFAVESLAGDVFQLGNQSYRIMRVERGAVRVEDAHGQPPTIPFWLGEAPGRSDELSASVSRLRAAIGAKLDAGEDAEGWLIGEGLGPAAAKELTEYLAAGHAALGSLPTQRNIIFERFFDESGGMQFVIHAPFGSRINRAWGLALRKRFCRKFNFELQAAATEDNIVLSLTASHSFDLEDVQRYLNSKTVREVLIQTLLDAPMFATRWRWVASVSLALPRFRGGKKRAPQLARMDAEDLLAAVFPDQVACAENLPGAREIPDHPLVRQTIHDCLHEAMDIDGLERLLRGLEAGEIHVEARDLAEPSQLALEVLSARPYAYLDDAPLEERRTQAVMGRRWLAPEDAADIGRLDPEAVLRVRSEAMPDPRNAEELHDALVWFGGLSEAEARAGDGWQEWLAALAQEKRATRIGGPRKSLWIAAERLPQFQALWPQAQLSPAVSAPANVNHNWSAETALVEIIRGRLEGQGPVTQADLAANLGLEPDAVEAALLALQAEGFALRGKYSPNVAADEWCDRRLVARIHRYTVKRLRAEIEPVAARDFMRFLLSWQRVEPEARMEGAAAAGVILAQLEGYEIPAGAWESEILPARLSRYDRRWLDELSATGRMIWSRVRRGDGAKPGGRPGPMRATPVALVARRHAAAWALRATAVDPETLSSKAKSLAAYLGDHGASFFDQMVGGAGLLQAELEGALAELAGLGLVTSDGFNGLRALIQPMRDGRRPAKWLESAGRWSLVSPSAPASASMETAEYVARALLLRYGVVFWKVLEREMTWLPPWRDLLAVYRRLESRGEIRGGRFVAGFPGEQFALPEAVGKLREVRRRAHTGAVLSVSGADPLNLAGVLTPGPKLPAVTRNRIAYRDGLPVAWFAGGEVHFLEDMPREDRWAVQKVLLQGRAVPASPSAHKSEFLPAAAE
ncbi:MAG: Lhr family helicase, partial [Rhodospirillaceae bacterium]